MKHKQKSIAKFITNLILLITLILIILISIYKFNNRNNNSLKQAFDNVSISISSTITPIPTPKEDTHINLSIIGDIMCHNTQYYDAYDISSNSYDFSYVFTDIEKYINSADLAIGNLETTFAGKEVGYSSYPTFNTPEELAQNLKNLGIDVLSTANNHCLDKRYSGLISTLDYLDEVGISHTGTYRNKEEQDTILVKDVKGIKIAFLAFTYGTNGIPIPSDKPYSVNLIDKDLILEQITLTKKQNVDLICVNMHWGIEYATQPNSEQEELADFLFENGVDIILGSHPHVLEPMEKRTITLDDGTSKDVFLIYSLGNFISGQTKTNTRNSIILNLSLTKNGETGKITIDEYSYVPIYLYKNSNVSKHKYKLIDLETAISDYENGDKTYLNVISTFKKELENINNILK